MYYNNSNETSLHGWCVMQTNYEVEGHLNYTKPKKL